MSGGARPDFLAMNFIRRDAQKTSPGTGHRLQNTGQIHEKRRSGAWHVSCIDLIHAVLNWI